MWLPFVCFFGYAFVCVFCFLLIATMSYAGYFLVRSLLFMLLFVFSVSC